MDYLEFNKSVIEEFRASGGVAGGPMEGRPLVLLTMTGAKSGRTLVSPLVYTTDGEDIIVIASYAGAPKHPNWYHNLVANPDVTLEIGDDTWEATALLTEEAERRRLFDAQAAGMDRFADYEKSAAEAGRVIPVFRLVKK